MARRAGLRRWAVRCLRVSTLVTLGTVAWALATTPAARWYSEATVAEIGLKLEAAIGREFDDRWYDATLREALAAAPVDWVLIDSARDLAAARGLSAREETAAALAAAEARDRSPLGLAANCAACAAGDPGCRLADGFYCAVGVELTPVGDARALIEEGRAYAAGEPVDEFSVGLAAVGIGATAAIVVSAGASAGVKGGVALTRVARQTAKLSPALQARLLAMGRSAVRWDRLPTRPAAAVSREAWLAALNRPVIGRIGALMGDLGAIGRAVPPAHGLAILAQIDTPLEARRLSAVANASGTRSVAVLHRLGKARTLRLTSRLSRAGRTITGLAAALAAQALALAFALGQGALARALKPGAR